MNSAVKCATGTSDVSITRLVLSGWEGNSHVAGNVTTVSSTSVQLTRFDLT